MATATALESFMRNLLDHHKGETALVIDDNATSSFLTGSGPQRSPFLPALGIPASSNHSCNRWSCEDGSPQRETMKFIPTTTIVSSPTVLMDDGLIKNTNSLPAFPVRKLSPQVHQRTEPSGRRRSPSSVYQLYERSTTIVEKQQPQKSNRPPLSPRKNSLAGQQKSGVSINNKTAPLQAPLRHPSETSVSQQWSLSTGHHAIKNSIFPSPSVWIGDDDDDDDPLFLNDESMEDDDIPPPPSQRPTRGLSATLGTDLPILPPVAPVRRVSAQIYDVEEEEEEEEDDTLSFYGSFLGDDDDDLSLQGVEDDLYLAYKAEEKLLLDFSSSSVMLSAAPLTVMALDCYISTSNTTKQTQRHAASRGPDVDEDLHPYLKPPRRSS